MINNDEQQVIALVGAIQALSAVQSVSIKGEFNEQHALPVFYSLINYNAEDTLAAYNNDRYALHHGFQQLKKMFSDALDRDLAQYMLAVITIERKLVTNPKMRGILQHQLQNLGNELRNDGQYDDNVGGDAENHTHELEEGLIHQNSIGRFADIYKQTASHTEPRIMVKGNHQFLQSETSANQIRALLLGALRGAAFFRHYGGKRMDFMMKRKQYLDIINRLN